MGIKKHPPICKGLRIFWLLRKNDGKNFTSLWEVEGRGERQVKSRLLHRGWEPGHRIFWLHVSLLHKMFPKVSHLRNPLFADNKTYGESYIETRMRKRHIDTAGHKFEEMWECEWDEMVKNDPRIKEIIRDTEILKPLNPISDSFFWGRTNATTIISAGYRW